MEKKTMAATVISELKVHFWTWISFSKLPPAVVTNLANVILYIGSYPSFPQFPCYLQLLLQEGFVTQ